MPNTCARWACRSRMKAARGRINVTAATPRCRAKGRFSCGSRTSTGVPPKRAAGAPPTAATPAPSSDSLAGANNPTHPPSSAPDATQGLDFHAQKKEKSLTDFLAPPQAADELGRLGKYRILK